MLHINDIHLGPNRTGGTTPLSYALLTNYAHDCFEQLLDLVENEPDKTVLIDGDLFDGFIISNNVLVRTFDAICERVQSGRIAKVYLSRGNHDISKNTEKLSSFDVLGSMLQSACNGFDAGAAPITVITEPMQIKWSGGGAGWVLPHLPNQDLFNEAINEICEDPRDFVFVHANYDNNFTVESDHSLNVSKDQVERMRKGGVKTVVFAHEHQQRQAPNVIVAGNQFPTSISDCLGNETKRALSFTGATCVTIATWEERGSYMEVDWQHLAKVPADVEFIRVKGEATDEQSHDVLEQISKLRKSHNAFVITNAVTIDGRALDISALEAVEKVQKFDILNMLADNLKPEQMEKVRGIVATRQVTESEDA